MLLALYFFVHMNQEVFVLFSFVSKVSKVSKRCETPIKCWRRVFSRPTHYPIKARQISTISSESIYYENKNPTYLGRIFILALINSICP